MIDNNALPPALADVEEGGDMTGPNEIAVPSEIAGPNESVDEQPLAPVDWRETLPAAEFCCWVVVILAPLLRLINGAAVTDDQAAIQVTLFSAALIAAISLRVFNWRRERKARR